MFSEDKKDIILNANQYRQSPPEEPPVELDYLAIFENTAVGMGVLKEDYTMSRVNEAGLKALGLTRDEMEGSSDWLHYIHQKDLVMLSSYHRERRQNPASVPTAYEIGVTDPFGKERYLWVSAAMIPGSTDSIITFVDITKNKSLEKQMTYRIKLEEVVSATSRLLISSRDDDAVQEVLQILGESMGLSRVFVYQLREEGNRMDNVYEWCDNETKPQLQNFQDVDVDRFPWWIKIIKTNQTYAIPDAQEIPPESTEEWLTIKGWGVRSMLCVPINNQKGEVSGFIGFMTYQHVQTWLGEDSLAMRIVAEMLGIYLERRKAERLLLRYRFIFENARDVILLMQRDGRITDANSQAVNLYGYEHDDLLSLSLMDLRAPEARSQAFPQMDEANLKGILFETLHCRKDGSVFPVEVSSQGIYIEQNRYLLSIVRDISERKKTEESLISLNRALDNSSNAVILTEPKGFKMLYQNQAFTNLLGYSLEELNAAGGFPALYAHKEMADEVYKNLHEGDVWQGELELFDKGGAIVQVQLYADRILNDAGMVLGLFGIITDIRERKLSEFALATEKERLAVTLQSIGDGVIATDVTGKILVINPVAEEIIGGEPGEVIGEQLIDVLPLSLGPAAQGDPGTDDSLDLILSGTNQSETLVQEAILVDRHGLTKTISVNSSPILDNGGKAIGYVLVVRNITDIIKAQMKMALSQKLEAIGALAAGIAHEINSPLQYIGDNTAFFQESIGQLMQLQQYYEGLVAAAEKGACLSEHITRVREMAEEIELDYLLKELPRAIEQTTDGIQRVRKLVFAMKEFSHPGTKEKKLSDLNKGIEATIAISRNEWKYVAELQTDLDPGLPLVDCVIDEINQVILNIIVNAAHAISDVIEQGGYAQGFIKLTSRLADGYVEVSIQDNGTGISKSVIAKIYDPFYTTKVVGKGTGQGLAIAHDIIVNKHQGNIDVYSEEGQGTTFVIRLPAATGQN